MDVLFSVVILLNDQNAYLLPFTLNSVSEQTFSSHEVIIIDSRKEKVDHEVFKNTLAHLTSIQSFSDVNLYAMMNEGIKAAKGRYLHFLVPGEFYLSCHGLSLVKECLEHHHFPDLVYSGYIIRHSLSPPQTVFKQISSEDLKGGKLPMSLLAFWMKKEALLSVGLFDKKFEMQGGIDLICRFYRRNDLKKIFLKRILTDYEYRRPPPKKVLRQQWETLLILWRHFGISKALFLWVARNHVRLFLWWLKNLKAAFWRRKISTHNF